MESAVLTSITLPSKSKAYESYENAEQPEIKTFRENFKKNIKTLTSISLKGNSYSKKFCEEFAKDLEQATSIQILDFNDIFVSRGKTELSQSVLALTNALITKPVLKLDLSNNALSISGAEALSGFLLQASTLQVFLVNNCGLGIDGVTIICDQLKRGTPNLEILAISRNRAEDPGASKIGEALQNLKKLKELHSYQNVIRKAGMVALMRGLLNCSNLEVLDVSDNFIKEEAGEELSKVVGKCNNLVSLNLSDCNMEQSENDVIVKSLEEKGEHKIEKLGYNYNELDEVNGKKLLDVLLKNSKNLKRIDIKGNEFKKSLRTHYKEKLAAAKIENVLSAFESDSENEDDLIKVFNELKI